MPGIGRASVFLRLVVMFLLLTPLVPSVSFTAFSRVTFIAAAMAAHAIGDVRDAFHLVLAHDVARSVLVAAIARVGGVLVRLVAGGAFRGMVSLEPEVGTVFECGR